MNGFIESFGKKRAIIVLGPGGVGKTTLSASLALALAKEHRSVLAITVDPSLRLRDALKIKGEKGVITPIPAGNGYLDALLLDTKTEMDRVVLQYVGDPDLRARISSNIFYQKAAGQSVGTHEYMAMIRLHDALKSDDYDVIVLDTPPTEHAIDFLTAPKRLSQLLSHDSLKAAAKVARYSGKGVLRLSGLVSRGLARFVDLSAFNALLEFVLSFGTLYDDLLSISEWFMDFLTGPDSEVVVVTGPCLQRIDDTISFIKHLKTISVPVDAIIANRVFQWETRPPEGTLHTELFKDIFSQPELRFMSRADQDTAIHKLVKTIEWFEEVRRAQSEQLKRITDTFPAIPVFTAPELETDITGPEDLDILVQKLVN